MIFCVRRVARIALTIAAISLGGHLHPLPSLAEAMHTPIEGFGAQTTGGAGKPECLVTSLADRGAGTLRDCLSAGNRHVKFAVAGTINLASQLSVRGSFVTIDGFTAPSPGITLRGWGLDIRDMHEIIVRGLRIRDVAGGYAGKSSTDCLLVYGPGSYNIVIDHVSIYNCSDGGLDISSGPTNITVQWTIVSAVKLALWGATSSSTASATDRISVHHSMFICGPEAISRGIGCDRAPLIRASDHAVTVDLRNNVFEGWIRANGTKIEAAAEVNVVGNAYIPRADSTFDHRQDSIAVNSGTRVYTAGNIELGPEPRPNLNHNGNEARPLPAPAITERELACVVRDAGMHPRDAVDRTLASYASRVPGDCDGSSTPPPPPPPPAAHPDLVSRALSAPNTGTVGQSLSVLTTIANIGTGTAPGSTARLYLSTDRSVSAGDAALGSITVPSLTGGATHSGTITVTLPTVTAGAYLLLVRADDAGAVAESDEANNVLAIPITIATAPSGPFAPMLLEAESMTITSGMSVGFDPAALGGRYISAPGGTNSTAPVREASQVVNIPAAGTYYLWARMHAPSTAADALYFGIDASWDRVYPTATATYQWVRIETANGSGTFGFQLAAGAHTIQVGRGEVNTRLDAVYLTNSATDVPAFTPQNTTFTPVVLEAEAMVLAPGMSRGSDPGALGGGYISPASGVNSTAPAREASVSLTIPKADTYYLWARVYGPSGAADALYLGIGSSWDRAYPSVHGSYQWVRIETTNGSGAFGFQLAPGTHTIQVGRGEVNTRLDAVYLTNSATDVPAFTPQSAAGLR